MKKILAALFICLAMGSAKADPFATAEVVPGTTQCGVLFDLLPKTTVLAVSVPTAAGAPGVAWSSTGLLCKYDLALISVGAHSVKFTAQAINDPVWGTQESPESSPLALTKPTPPIAPSGLKIFAR